MTADKLYEAYRQLLRESGGWSVCESRDRHELNANYLRNLRKIEVDSFLGAFAYYKYTLIPRARKAEQLVYAKEYGGHITIKTPDYEAVHQEMFDIVQDIQRYYKHVCDLDEQIAQELAAKREADARAALNEWRRENAPPATLPVIAGEQLKLFS